MEITTDEGRLARAIESQLSKVSSDYFMWTGLGLLGLSCIMYAFRHRRFGWKLGQAAAPLLIVGLYNKAAKLTQSSHELEDQFVESIEF